jgi:sugar phosphate isomerase/epimerase
MNIPIALQMYSVRAAFQENPLATMRAVKAMGYAGVEFFGAPQYCAEFYAGLLQESGLVCCGWLWSNILQQSSLEDAVSFNRAIGNHTLICGSVKHENQAGIRANARRFNEVADFLAPRGMRFGYHSHKGDHPLVDGVSPWELLMSETDDRVIMQLDTGNSIDGGADILDILDRFPGRCQTIHMKPHRAGQYETGIRPVIGEDDCPWQEVIDFCRTRGKTEWYIIEYGNTEPNALETAEQCLRGLEALL